MARVATAAAIAVFRAPLIRRRLAQAGGRHIDVAAEAGRRCNAHVDTDGNTRHGIEARHGKRRRKVAHDGRAVEIGAARRVRVVDGIEEIGRRQYHLDCLLLAAARAKDNAGAQADSCARLRPVDRPFGNVEHRRRRIVAEIAGAPRPAKLAKGNARTRIGRRRARRLCQRHEGVVGLAFVAAVAAAAKTVVEACRARRRAKPAVGARRGARAVDAARRTGVVAARRQHGRPVVGLGWWYDHNSLWNNVTDSKYRQINI